MKHTNHSHKCTPLAHNPAVSSMHVCMHICVCVCVWNFCENTRAPRQAFAYVCDLVPGCAFILVQCGNNEDVVDTIPTSDAALCERWMPRVSASILYLHVCLRIVLSHTCLVHINDLQVDFVCVVRECWCVFAVEERSVRGSVRFIFCVRF